MDNGDVFLGYMLGRGVGYQAPQQFNPYAFLHSHGPGERHVHEHYGSHFHPLPPQQSLDYVYAEDRALYNQGTYTKPVPEASGWAWMFWCIVGFFAGAWAINQVTGWTELTLFIPSLAVGFMLAHGYGSLRTVERPIIMTVDGQSDYYELRPVGMNRLPEQR